MTSATAQHLLQLGQRLIRQRGLILSLTEGAAVLARSLAEAERVLTPPDGWPGSNEDKRRAAKTAALAADPEWVHLSDQLQRGQRELEHARHELQCLVDEREAFALAIEAERTYQAATSLFGAANVPDLARVWTEGPQEEPWRKEIARHQHDLWLQVAGHPPTDECPDPECSLCALRDCPYGDVLHYHHDGCPSCYDEQLAEADRWTAEQERLGDQQVRDSAIDEEIRHELNEPRPEDDPNHPDYIPF